MLASPRENGIDSLGLRRSGFSRKGPATILVVSRDACSDSTLRLLNALNSEDRGLKVRFSLATIAFETFELILCQMLSSQGKNAPSNPYPHYLVRLAASRYYSACSPENFCEIFILRVHLGIWRCKMVFFFSVNF